MENGMRLLAIPVDVVFLVGYFIATSHFWHLQKKDLVPMSGYLRTCGVFGMLILVNCMVIFYVTLDHQVVSWGIIVSLIWVWLIRCLRWFMRRKQQPADK